MFDDIIGAPPGTVVETANCARIDQVSTGLEAGDSVVPSVDGDDVMVSSAQYRSAPTCDDLGEQAWADFGSGAPISIGDFVQLRAEAAPSFLTMRQLRFNVGDVFAVWRITTGQAEISIDDYPDSHNVERNTLTVASESRSPSSSIAGTMEPVFAYVDGEGDPMYRVRHNGDWSGWTALPMIVHEPDDIEIRLRSAPMSNSERSARVYIGDPSSNDTPYAQYTVTTGAASPPDLENNFGAGDYIDLTDQPVSTLIHSNEVIVSSSSDATWFVSPADGGATQTAMSINGDDSWQTTPHEVSDGDRIRLRHLSADVEGQTRTSGIEFRETPDLEAPSIGSRQWNTTTGIGVDQCQNETVVGTMTGSSSFFTVGFDTDDQKMAAGSIHRFPSLIGGDHVAIDLTQLDNIADWVNEFGPDLLNERPTRRKAVLFEPPRMVGGTLDTDLLCGNPSTNPGLTGSPGGGDLPSGGYFVEISGYSETYASGCCAPEEFGYLSYPFGRAVNDPNQTPLDFPRPEPDGDIDGSIDISIGQPPMKDESWGLNDPENAYLMINGEDRGQGAWVMPGDDVELALRTSEGMYHYDVELLINGYATRRFAMPVPHKPPFGADFQRGIDFGTYEIPHGETGEYDIDDIFNLPEYLIDPDDYYPDGIRTLDPGVREMRGPTMLAVVPLNFHAAQLWAARHEMDVLGSPLLVPTMNLRESDYDRRHDGVNNSPRSVHAYTGESFGVWFRWAQQVQEEAQFGVMASYYQEGLSVGRGNIGTTALGTFSGTPIDVPDDPGSWTVFTEQPQEWHDQLLGTFTIDVADVELETLTTMAITEGQYNQMNSAGAVCEGAYSGGQELVREDFTSDPRVIDVPIAGVSGDGCVVAANFMDFFGTPWFQSATLAYMPN